MTQVDELIVWFSARPQGATLGEILRSGERWSYEWRARITDAKKKGYFHTCERGTTPSENRYRLIIPEGNQMRCA